MVTTPKTTSISIVLVPFLLTWTVTGPNGPVIKIVSNLNITDKIIYIFFPQQFASLQKKCNKEQGLFKTLSNITNTAFCEISKRCFFIVPKIVFSNKLCFFYQLSFLVIISTLLVANSTQKDFMKFLSIFVQPKFDFIRLFYGLSKSRMTNEQKTYLELQSRRVLIFYYHLNK